MEPHESRQDEQIDDALLLEDDALLTALSRGTDPSQGNDPLVALLLELRDEVEAPMPEAPDVAAAEQAAGVTAAEERDEEAATAETPVVVVKQAADGEATELAEAEEATNPAEPEATTDEFDEVEAAEATEPADSPVAAAAAVPPEAEGITHADTELNNADVVDMAQQRKRRRFAVSPWGAGLIGAAAATVVVAGSGALLYNATPGSALWGPSKAVFSDRTDMVELASTLDEIGTKTESGDINGARFLIDQLRSSIKLDRDTPEAPVEKEVTEQTRLQKETVTVSQDPKQPKPKAENEEPQASQAPQGSTVTVTPPAATVTVTVTAPAAPAAPAGGATQGSGQQGQATSPAQNPNPGQQSTQSQQ